MDEKIELERVTRTNLELLGFEEIPQMTVMNSMIKSVGRNRVLSVGCIGTPNEMMFIQEVDKEDSRKINDLVCLHNFDYDGPLYINKVSSIIEALTNKKIQK